MSREPASLLRRSEVLTQYGQARSGFRRAPRPGIEQGISLIRGALTVEEATRLVCRRAARRGDAARHTTVRRLVQAGFSVVPTPTRWIPGHVRVRYPGEWTTDVARRFDRCFDAPVVKGP